MILVVSLDEPGEKVLITVSWALNIIFLGYLSYLGHLNPPKCEVGPPLCPMNYGAVLPVVGMFFLTIGYLGVCFCGDKYTWYSFL